MKVQTAVIMLTIIMTSVLAVAQDASKNVYPQERNSFFQHIEIPFAPIQLAFVGSIGTGGWKALEKGYHVSINILCGAIGQLKGFEVSGMYNLNKYGAIGVQIAGLGNMAMFNNQHFKSNNVQFAGLFNYTECGRSVQFAGGINWMDDFAYFQLGGICNVTLESAGAQLAGIFNYASDASFQGAGICNVAAETPFQVAGVVNIAYKPTFQVAGLCNVSSRVRFQVAGYVNIAKKSTCQIAAYVNSTKKGRFQMGLVNVRDTVDGVSLGLINIVKHGGVMEAGIEAGEFVHTALTFRSGVPRLYSTLFVGYNYVDKFFAVGSGPATSFKLTRNLELNLELAYAALFGIKSDLFDVITFWRNSLFQFKPVLNYRFTNHFKIYAGPSLNLLVLDTEDGSWFLGPPLGVTIPYKMYHQDFKFSTLDMWVGVVGGIKF